MSRKTAGVADAKSARQGQLGVGSYLMEHKFMIQDLIVLMRRHGLIGCMRSFLGQGLSFWMEFVLLLHNISFFYFNGCLEVILLTKWEPYGRKDWGVSCVNWLLLGNDSFMLVGCIGVIYVGVREAYF